MITTLEIYKEELERVNKRLEWYLKKLTEIDNDEFMKDTDIYKIYKEEFEEKKKYKSFLLDNIARLEGRSIGRPSKGITKKVSITMSQIAWDFVEKQDENKSSYFRNLVESEILIWKEKYD